MLTLLFRHRHSRDAVNAKESMSHALIRSLLNLGETDRLLKVLRDKVSDSLRPLCRVLTCLCIGVFAFVRVSFTESHCYVGSEAVE